MSFKLTVTILVVLVLVVEPIAVVRSERRTWELAGLDSLVDSAVVFPGALVHRRDGIGQHRQSGWSRHIHSPRRRSEPEHRKKSLMTRRAAIRVGVESEVEEPGRGGVSHADTTETDQQLNARHEGLGTFL